MFIDEVVVRVLGGKGGDGCVAFLREKFRPWGGPAGGDGGKGGDVILESTSQADTLLPLYRRKLLRAQNGLPGGNKNCSGKAGKNLVVRVPPGTVVRDNLSGEILFDFTAPAQRYVAAPGGRGGRGNQHFATSTHQTPREFEHGADGAEGVLHLELKLIADVGLIGLPNAGKSTLLSVLSSARPRIAPYPFTTKEPQLGIVELAPYRQIVMADLPGLIEGAHAGAGLGDEFLRHVERTSMLIHILDAAPDDGSDPAENFRLIERELQLYSAVLASRPRVVVANKLDLPEAPENVERLRQELQCEVIAISAMTRQGLTELLQKLLAWADAAKQPQKDEW